MEPAATRVTIPNEFTVATPVSLDEYVIVAGEPLDDANENDTSTPYVFVYELVTVKNGLADVPYVTTEFVGNWDCNVIADAFLWDASVNPTHWKFIEKSLAKFVVPTDNIVAPLLK